MIKSQELLSSTSCLNKAMSDEPVFVLRAKDPCAAQTIRLWAAMAANIHEPDKIEEAMRFAEHIDSWRLSRSEEQTVLMSATPVLPALCVEAGRLTVFKE